MPSWGRCVRAAIAATFAGVLSLNAVAAEYPSKPIRMLIPFPPGGSTDILARVVATHLAQAWGQQVVPENRPGANGIIAAELLTKSPPDGHTLLFVAMGHAINSLIYKKLPYDTERDFTPITLAALYSQLVLVHPSVPVHSVKELIALAKTRRLTFASGGIGSSQHLAGALFSHMARIEMDHVPYKGGAPGLVDVMAGNVDLMITQPTSNEQIKAGKLRPLAISSPKRSPHWPDVPTVAEAALPGYQSEAWYGLVAPKGLPPDILKQVNEESVRALKAPKLKENLAVQNGTPVGSTAEEFSAFIAAEINRYAKVVREAKISAD